jgi:transcriptional regulator with GAF, ATPase, and Fis domain
LFNQNKLNHEFLEFARILGKQNDFQIILRLITLKSAQFLKAELVLLLMLNPDTRETIKIIMKDGHTIRQKEYRDVHIHVGGWILSTGRTFISTDLQNDNRFTKGLFDNVPLSTVAGVPLFIEGVIIGALVLLYQDGSDIDKPEFILTMENLAAIIAPFLYNAQKIRPLFLPSLPKASLILKYKNAGLIGKCLKFIEMLQAIEAATKCDARVLLIGNTGTGKELIARAIHHFSTRSNGPYITVDCGAIPNSLLESELFGHTRGAFTGATTNRRGLFLEANGGTFFMDEINNLPLIMQSKLLRVMEEGSVRPVGSDNLVNIDVRIITSSSIPLIELVEKQHFREDLYYRLYVYPIYVPDLSERRQDIALLAGHFLDLYARQQHKIIRNFHEEVIDFIKQRPWNGNIRELENFIERLVTLTPENVQIIGFELFPADLRDEIDHFQEQYNPNKSSESLKEQLQNFEFQLIKQTLIECDWNQSEVSRRLQTTEKNIRYKMARLHIQKP